MIELNNYYLYGSIVYEKLKGTKNNMKYGKIIYVILLEVGQKILFERLSATVLYLKSTVFEERLFNKKHFNSIFE